MALFQRYMKSVQGHRIGRGQPKEESTACNHTLIISNETDLEFTPGHGDLTYLTVQRGREKIVLALTESQVYGLTSGLGRIAWLRKEARKNGSGKHD